MSLVRFRLWALCGCSSMVEHQPSKLDTWVRFPSPALEKHVQLVHVFFFVSGNVVLAKGKGIADKNYHYYRKSLFFLYLLFLLLGHETLSEYFVSTFLHLKWKIINPSTSIPPITATPTLELSASWVVIPINIVPRKDAPLPKIS